MSRTQPTTLAKALCALAAAWLMPSGSALSAQGIALGAWCDAVRPAFRQAAFSEIVPTRPCWAFGLHAGPVIGSSARALFTIGYVTAGIQERVRVNGGGIGSSIHADLSGLALGGALSFDAVNAGRLRLNFSTGVRYLNWMRYSGELTDGSSGARMPIRRTFQNGNDLMLLTQAAIARDIGRRTMFSVGITFQPTLLDGAERTAVHAVPQRPSIRSMAGLSASIVLRLPERQP